MRSCGSCLLTALRSVDQGWGVPRGPAVQALGNATINHNSLKQAFRRCVFCVLTARTCTVHSTPQPGSPTALGSPLRGQPFVYFVCLPVHHLGVTECHILPIPAVTLDCGLLRHLEIQQRSQSCKQGALGACSTRKQTRRRSYPTHLGT